MTTTALAPKLQSGSWEVDPERSVASFTVSNFGLKEVRGTIAVEHGQVTVAHGQPVGATATLAAASVSTGSAKRDSDLTGRHFFATADHPTIQVTVDDVRADYDGWTATAVIHVAGGRAPIALRICRKEDGDAGTVRVTASGVLDRAATPIRAPRFLVGRWISVHVDATLQLAPTS